MLYSIPCHICFHIGLNGMATTEVVVHFNLFVVKQAALSLMQPHCANLLICGNFYQIDFMG